MNAVADLLRRLRDLDDVQRDAAILEWLLADLPAQGAAVLDGREVQMPEIRASAGTLVDAGPLLAAEWSASGLPRKPCVLPLGPGNSGGGELYCLPVGAARAPVKSVLVIHGPGIAEIAARRDDDLLVVGSQLGHGPVRTAAGRHRASPGSGARSHQPDGLSSSALDALMDGMGLPRYVCDAAGRFLSVSPAFLELAEVPSLESLAAQDVFFVDPARRQEELEAVRRDGRAGPLHLVIRSGRGTPKDIQDYAVSSGGTVVGIFFNVTSLMSRQTELQELLLQQEVLNDKIMEGTRDLHRTQGAAIRSLARLAEYRDPETGFHLQRICEYARILALKVHEIDPYPFRISEEYGNEISLSSMLHDIGKVSIPDTILLKPGKLDPDEWEMMKKHTVFGWQVLSKADKELGKQSFLTLASSIALQHHERYDGAGYPNGYAGDTIHLSGRISAVADVYDALTSPRPYKEAWTHDQAVEEILRQSGTQFDPVLVNIFGSVNGEFAQVRSRFPE